MARHWSADDEELHRTQLRELYVIQNKTIGEIAPLLGIAESTVFDRMMRLGITSTPERKKTSVRNRRTVALPVGRSDDLAEFYGVMLGDGHISRFQALVTLGTKEYAYVQYVAALMQNLFGVEARIATRRNNYRDVYIGSVSITEMLKADGLMSNKVAAQVDVPAWIFETPTRMRSFLRGFFDTDGSIYRLRFGRQISFTNHSAPILHSLRRMLCELEYKPSKVSGPRLYLTRRDDIDRFFREIRPANAKHVARYAFLSRT